MTAAALSPHWAEAGKRLIVFQWHVSSLAGWGIYGINLMLGWARDPEVMPLTSCAIRRQHIHVTEAQARLLAPLLDRSQALQSGLAKEAGRTVTVPAPVLHSIASGLKAQRSIGNTLLEGQPSIAIPFLERTHIDDRARARARDRYALWVAGSAWNAAILHNAGLGPIATVVQGVDPERFHPGPRTGRFGERFVVFSGGKLEFRKGQDLVVLAFREFGARHPEALLVTAWHNPWSDWARTIDRNAKLRPMAFDADGRPSIVPWAVANGIAERQIIDLGAVPNVAMGDLLREIDVAVFPNRAEGGTNLVAMECMACGVPTLLAANTGQLDLIREDNCFALRRQSPVGDDGHGTEGWGESDVDEIVETLELAWRDRAAARAIGARGAAFMREHSWDRQMALLKEAIRPYWR